MGKHYVTGLTIRHVIMSRGRSDRVTTHKLVARGTLVVPENEVEAYPPLGLDIVPTPPDRIGVNAVRNWIVRRFEGEAVVMYDDDVTACRALAGLTNRYISPDEVAAMVENTAYCCAGAGARLFGWHQRPDARVIARNHPLTVFNWVGVVVGVVGKEVRWDELRKRGLDIAQKSDRRGGPP